MKHDNTPINFGNDPAITKYFEEREPVRFPIVAALACAGTGLFVAFTAPGFLIYVGPIPFMYLVIKLWPWLTQIGRNMGATHMEIVNHDDKSR
mgnify:CR=1 FL=1